MSSSKIFFLIELNIYDDTKTDWGGSILVILTSPRPSPKSEPKPNQGKWEFGLWVVTKILWLKLHIVKDFNLQNDANNSNTAPLTRMLQSLDFTRKS